MWTRSRIEALVAPHSRLVSLSREGRKAQLSLRCRVCQATWRVMLESLLRDGHVRGCPACISCSFAEAWTVCTMQFLMGEAAERQARPDWLRTAPGCNTQMAFDAFFPGYQMGGHRGLVVEHHGSQHYTSEHFFRGSVARDRAKAAAAKAAGVRLVAVSDLHQAGDWARHLCDCIEHDAPEFFLDALRRARRDALLGGMAPELDVMVSSRHTGLLQEVRRRGHEFRGWSSDYRRIRLKCARPSHPEWSASLSNYLPGDGRDGTDCMKCAASRRGDARRIPAARVDADALALGWRAIDQPNVTVTERRWWECVACGDTRVETSYRNLSRQRPCPCRKRAQVSAQTESFLEAMRRTNDVQDSWEVAADRHGLPLALARGALREAGMLTARLRIRWTDGDIALLRAAHAAGVDDPALISKFGPKACSQKRSELGLVRKGTGRRRAERTWAAEELFQLRERVPTEGILAAARALERPLHQVRQKVKEMGLKVAPPTRSQAWSTDEHETFIDTYTSHGAAAAAAATGRSIKAVRRRAELAKLKSGAMPRRTRIGQST